MARRLVVLFRSVHHAMGGQRTAKAVGAWCDLVPVPRELSSDCGMALEVRFEDAGRLLGEWRRAHVEVDRIYERTDSGFVEVDGAGLAPAPGPPAEERVHD